MKEQSNNPITLGLDIGPNSIGWALIGNDDRGKPKEIITAGTRVFEAGLDDLQQDGKGKSRNTNRREARSRRRLLERRTRRLTVLAKNLQKCGLLPEGNLADSIERHRLFNELDNKYDDPYTLRARALKEKLSFIELGRALYHLAQRRGFLSNRKSVSDAEEEKGIKKKIGDLARTIEESGNTTLGEYFSKLDPHEERLRSRYTSRKMYLDEFEKIWEKQTEYYPDILTDEFKKKIHRIIFYQRPLKSQKGLIGECELEPGRIRAPWGLPQSQRFRYLQTINNLKVADDRKSVLREITDDEYYKIVSHLESEGDLTFAKARKILELKRTAKFNLELGGEKRLVGNRTAAKLSEIFGKDRWQKFDDSDKNAIVEDLRSIVKDETLKNRAMRVWKLSEEQAEKLSRVRLEDGYCNFSRQAIEKLTPLLENRIPLQTAIKEIYPEHFEREGEFHDLLPPFSDSGLASLRNPIVERSLTELRKVVNSIIREYGKPDIVRIELARDLKQPSKQREKATKKMRANEHARKRAAQKIMDEAKIENPSREDILKVILAEECNWTCPYTGKQISIGALLGDHPQFDIEHIIPFDRSLNNSFINKTLCDAEENRNVKRNRTPYEAYNSTSKWDDIIARVSGFNSDVKFAKLRLFKMTPEKVEEEFSKFTSRQLNDTRWASVLAKKYLGLLYGGINNDGIDAGGKRKIHAISGPGTAYLRDEWGLNAVLGDGPGKSRDDHRHHAVDAVVVALTTPGNVKLLSKSAQSSNYGKRKFTDIPPPWENFLENVRSSISPIVTSHRLSRRVRGELHKESFYGRPRVDEKGKTYVAIRKPLEKMTKKEVENIIDPAIRNIVKEKMKSLKQEDPKKAFAESENHPVIKSSNGKSIPIHKARIRMNLSETFTAGSGHRARHVISDANHHMEIVEVRNPENGEIKWEGHVVSMFEAYQRHKNGEPIVKRNYGENENFLFSLAGGDIIELDNPEDNMRELYIIRTVPKSKQLYFVPVNDARKLSDIGKKGLTAPPDSLRIRKCQKMVITPLGEIRTANN